MTREEAIKILKFQRGYFCDFKGCEEQQAFTMAIEALQKEPCDDAISRKAAINAFNAFADEVNQDTDIHEAIEIVLNLPSVIPTEKVGH
jgi:hypothetical protein